MIFHYFRTSFIRNICTISHVPSLPLCNTSTLICRKRPYAIGLKYSLAFGRRILLKPIAVEHDWNVGPRMTPAREIWERFRNEHERGVVAKGRLAGGRGCISTRAGRKVEGSRDRADSAGTTAGEGVEGGCGSRDFYAIVTEVPSVPQELSRDTDVRERRNCPPVTACDRSV